MTYKDITSHKIACKVLKKSTKMPNVSMLPKKQGQAILADIMLIDIAKAINLIDSKFKANYNDPNQKKWYPFFDIAEGFRFNHSLYVGYYTFTTVSSRLCFRFRSQEIADFFGKQFNSLHKKSFNA